MKDLIQAQEKEFDEKFGTFPNEFSWKTLHGDNTICTFCGHPANPNEVLDNLKTWHKSSTKALLEAVIEMVESEKWLQDKPKEYVPQTDKELVECSAIIGHNQALTDLQDKLKEEMSKI